MDDRAINLISYAINSFVSTVNSRQRQLQVEEEARQRRFWYRIGRSGRFFIRFFIAIFCLTWVFTGNFILFNSLNMGLNNCDATAISTWSCWLTIHSNLWWIGIFMDIIALATVFAWIFNDDFY